MAGVMGRGGGGVTVGTKAPDDVEGREAKRYLFALGHRHMIFHSICEGL